MTSLRLTSDLIAGEEEAQSLRNVAGLLRKADVRKITLGSIGLEMPDGSYAIAMDNPFLPSGESTGVIAWFASKKAYEEGCKFGQRIADHMTRQEAFPNLSAATTYLLELVSE